MDGKIKLALTSRRRGCLDVVTLIGLEPDECYYVQTPAPPASEGEFDLSIHPPPDLAIEVEISQGTISKMPIYSALKVREIWCYRVGRIVPMHLGKSGEYEVSKN